MTDRESMQHALECLEWHIEAGAYGHDIEGTAGLLRALLAEPEQGPMKHGGRPMTLRECMEAEEPAQPEQEPVAWVAPSWMNPETRTWENESFAPRPINGWIPLYTAPPQRKPLTDEEINSLWDGHVVPVFGKNGINPIVFARAIEAKLRERNA